MFLSSLIILSLILIINLVFIILYLKRADNRGELLEIAARLSVAQKEIEYLTNERDTLKVTYEEGRIKLIKAEDLVNNLNQEKLQLSLQVERLIAENHGLKEAYAQLQDLLNKFKYDINQEFIHLRNQAISDLKAEATSSLKQIGKTEVVEPLDKNLQQLQEKIIKLTEQTKLINDNSKELNVQAQNLTNALIKDSQKKGAFGEMILSNILESVGLKSHLSYVEQAHFKYEGETLIPDVIIHMPDKRGLIVDSKNIMQAYYAGVVEGYNDYGTIKKLLQKTIKGLADKDYVRAVEANVNRIIFEYIVMFIPNEGLFNFVIAEDMKQNGSLMNEAYKNKIILAGPSTILSLVALIEKMWHSYEIEERADEVIKAARDLADKSRITANNLAKLGASLGSSIETYNKLIASFDNGRADCVLNRTLSLANTDLSKPLEPILKEIRTSGSLSTAS